MVSEFGGGTIPGSDPDSDTLSSGVQVAVLAREASRPYALANLNRGHADLGQAIRGGSAKVFRLAEDGRTPQTFKQTQASGKVYYVLALTGQGELLESYVKDDNRGGRYYPGFGRVVSGDVVMGPVPEEHREPLRASLKSAMGPVVAGTADGSQAGEDSGGVYLQSLWAALSSWYGALVLGLLTGGVGAWWLYRKYSKKLSKKRIKIDRLGKEIYRKSSKKNSGVKNSVHKEILDKEKKKTKELKKKLKRKEEKIGRLESELNQSEGTSSRKTSDQKSEPSVSKAYGSNSYDEGSPWARDVDSEVTTVGKVFADWCRTTGDQSGRELEDFAEQLEAEVPGAEVHRIYREKYAEELVFTESAREPVGYWLVRLGQRSLLLPKPQQSGFREIKECFEGENVSSDESESELSAIAPEDVKHMLPATLAEEGGRGRALAEKGYVSSGNTRRNESPSHTAGTEDDTTK
jgi:hypothetical protein